MVPIQNDHAIAEFDDQVEIYPRAFLGPIPGTPPADMVDDVTVEVMARIVGATGISTPDKATGLDIVGRLLGETLAHEICHSLIGPVLSGPKGHHEKSRVPHEMMNMGRNRSFEDRTGFKVTPPVTTLALGTFLSDQGKWKINIPHGRSLTEMQRHFPAKLK